MRTLCVASRGHEAVSARRDANTAFAAAGIEIHIPFCRGVVRLECAAIREVCRTLETAPPIITSCRIPRAGTRRMR